VIYADYRYHWSDSTVGLSLAVVGIFSALYGAVLVKPAVKALGERGAIMLGLLGGASGYMLFALSNTGTLFWFGIPLLNLMSITWPSVQGLLSRRIGPSEQGQMQGAINSLRGFAGLIGPGIFTYIFSKSIGSNPIIPLPGMPFFTAAAMLVIAFILAERSTHRSA
jgi:DHA1 family tetracycline resistance protein-like MFS transporter